MAGAGYREWVAGELITDAHMQNYLQDQVIMKFASIAARDNAPTTQGLVLAEGMYCTVNDTDLLYRYSGTAWVEAGGGGGGAGLTVSDTAPSTPVDGAQWFNSTNGKTYVYYTDADSSQWVELDSSGAPISSAVPSGNAIINGAFDIWQRGTSGSGATGGTNGFVADRWQGYRGAYTSGMTMSQITGPTASRYAIRIQRTASNTSTADMFFGQSLETNTSIPFASKSITISFKARAGANYSAASSILKVNVIQGQGTDQNITSGFTSQSDVILQNVTLTTSWQTFTLTGTVNSATTQIAPIFIWTPVGTAGAADYVEIAEVQLEAGSVATPFKRNAPSIQAELAACQRYYWRITATDAYGMFTNMGPASSTTAAKTLVVFPVEMRTAPTSVEYSTILVDDLYSGGQAATAISASNRTTRMAMIEATVASGLTTGRQYALRGNNNTAAYLALNSEL